MKCKVCGIVLRVDRLENHIALKHTVVKCPICEQSMEKGDLNLHMRIEHESTKSDNSDETSLKRQRKDNSIEQSEKKAALVACPICNKHFSESNLVGHLDRSHPFVKCEICGEMLRSGFLKQHIAEIHSTPD